MKLSYTVNTREGGKEQVHLNPQKKKKRKRKRGLCHASRKKKKEDRRRRSEEEELALILCQRKLTCKIVDWFFFLSCYSCRPKLARMAEMTQIFFWAGTRGCLISVYTPVQDIPVVLTETESHSQLWFKVNVTYFKKF